MSSTISSRYSRSSSRSFPKRAWRSFPGLADHSGKAFRAAVTASFKSSSAAIGTFHNDEPFDGLIPLLVTAEVRSSPPMTLQKSRKEIVFRAMSKVSRYCMLGGWSLRTVLRESGQPTYNVTPSARTLNPPGDSGCSCSIRIFLPEFSKHLYGK